MSFLVANSTGAPPIWVKGISVCSHILIQSSFEFFKILNASVVNYISCISYFAYVGKIFEIGSTGISSSGGHTERRTHCVNRFVYEYGGMPLIPTSVKAVDSHDIWFW